MDLLKLDRHRGQPNGCTPATPPGMRVRTGRFEKLRSCESGDSYAIEVFYRENTVYIRKAAVPPSITCSCYQGGQLMSSSKTPQTAVDRRSASPVLELDRPETTTYP